MDPAKSLLIRDLSVVEDPTRTVWTGATDTSAEGAWSFGRLMAHLAGAHEPSEFVRRWLENWERDQTINGFSVQNRATIATTVIDPWPKLPDGKLDLTQAPMRLLGIVYRPDLRNPGLDRGGEGRFVFGVLDRFGNKLQFTVILEYDLAAQTDAEVQTWAADFQNLSTLEFGEAFNTELEAITNRFAGPGVAPDKINGSAILRVRTNEIALAFPWELREFALSGNGRRLREVTVKQTPDIGLNNTGIFAEWIDANAERIRSKPNNGSIQVPSAFKGVPFLAGAIANNLDVWDAPASDGEAVFRVALNTCNGCHGVESGTSFLHVNPRTSGSEAVLSEFLTGTMVSDPRDGEITREFNELEARSAEVDAILCPSP
ncbi:MAG: hypothetical protein ACREV4_11375 [Gammaproteobacteria bacterium]